VDLAADVRRTEEAPDQHGQGFRHCVTQEQEIVNRLKRPRAISNRIRTMLLALGQTVLRTG
jgi:hypothetical protein